MPLSFQPFIPSASLVVNEGISIPNCFNPFVRVVGRHAIVTKSHQTVLMAYFKRVAVRVEELFHVGESVRILGRVSTYFSTAFQPHQNVLVFFEDIGKDALAVVKPFLFGDLASLHGGEHFLIFGGVGHGGGGVGHGERVTWKADGVNNFL